MNTSSGEFSKRDLGHTNTERYGVANPMQNAEVQQKLKDTNTERYGA